MFDIFKEIVQGSILHEITSKELIELFSSFTVKCPEDSLNKSFVHKILNEDFLQEYEAAIKSLSGGVMLTRNIDRIMNIKEFTEMWVFEVDVVCDRDKFKIIKKVTILNIII